MKQLKIVFLMIKFLAAAAAIVIALYLGYLWVERPYQDDYSVIIHQSTQATVTLTAQEASDER